MLLNSVWMIGKNSPALALSSWTTGGCFKYPPKSAATLALRKPPSAVPVAAGSTAMRASPAKNPCWRLTACPCLPLRFFGAGTFSTAATISLLSGLAVLRPRLFQVPGAPVEGFIRFQKAVQRTRRILAQPMAQLVRHGPGRLIGHTEFALQKLGRDATLVAATQRGGNKPLGQIGSRPVKHRSSGRRFLPAAGRTFVHPRARLQPPRHAAAAPGTGKSAGPAEPGQVFDALLLGSKLHHKLSQPSH